jgi:hypothetical protein
VRGILPVKVWVSESVTVSNRTTFTGVDVAVAVGVALEVAVGDAVAVAVAVGATVADAVAVAVGATVAVAVAVAVAIGDAVAVAVAVGVGTAPQAPGPGVLSTNPETVPLKTEEFVAPVVVLTTMTKFVAAGTVNE